MISLYSAIQALAQPYEIQISLFPEFANIQSELVLDLEEVITSENFIEEEKKLLDNQKKSVYELDQYIIKINQSGIDDIWDKDALKFHPEWEKVRLLARNVLHEMGWAMEYPSKNNAVYVNKNGTIVNE